MDIKHLDTFLMAFKMVCNPLRGRGSERRLIIAQGQWSSLKNELRGRMTHVGT